MKEGIYETAEDEHWVKAEWYVLSSLNNLFSHWTRFKLHLRSPFAAGGNVAKNIPPLPLNKTVVEVFADFMSYMFQCASSFIRETHANGDKLWESVKDEIHFVLSHPNGWEGAQQAEMRKGAVLAKLIPNTTTGHARLSFVTEGEASLHFALQNGLPMGVLENGDGVVIADAGGGTIDVSSYRKSVKKREFIFEEVAAPQSMTYFIKFIFFNLIQISLFTHRPFSWLGLRDSPCTTILGECVLPSAKLF